MSWLPQNKSIFKEISQKSKHSKLRLFAYLKRTKTGSAESLEFDPIKQKKKLCELCTVCLIGRGGYWCVVNSENAVLFRPPVCCLFEKNVVRSSNRDKRSLNGLFLGRLRVIQLVFFIFCFQTKVFPVTSWHFQAFKDFSQGFWIKKKIGMERSMQEEEFVSSELLN